MITDTAVLHTGTNNIINSENNKDIVADSIINIAGEKCCFISTVNKTLKPKCLSYTIIVIFLITRISKRRIFGRTVYRLTVQVKIF